MIGMTLLGLLHWLAGFVILAEALNKLQRCDPLNAAHTHYSRLMDVLKAVAWLCLALGAGGAMITPMLSLDVAQHHYAWLLDPPTVAGTAALVGCAVLVIRTRIRETHESGFSLRGEDTSPHPISKT